MTNAGFGFFAEKIESLLSPNRSNLANPTQAILIPAGYSKSLTSPGRSGLENAPRRHQGHKASASSAAASSTASSSTASSLPATRTLRFRLELKPGCGLLLSEKFGKPRPTVLGLATRKAWQDLSQSFEPWSTGALSLSPQSLEGQLFFTGKSSPETSGASPKPELVDVVQHFKRLCFERASHSKRSKVLCDELWLPGYMEISEIPAQDSGL